MDIKRCLWVPNNNSLYTKYHDEEWGVPVHDDKIIFEFLLLESFQAGLSWLTILKKRENFKKAFSNFDFMKVAKFNDKDVERLLKDKEIIRNKLKILATINNAQKFIEVKSKNKSFSNFLWSFVDGSPIVNKFKEIGEVPSKTFLSEKISKELKSLGFKFLGPTVMYSHMQATGIVNDHITSCFRYKEIKLLARESFFS